MKVFSGLHTPKGEPIYTQEYIQSLRDKRDEKKIIAQLGGQENALACPAQFLIFGGKRGGPLPVGTRVVTPFGYRRIGDMKAGDIISSTDGGMQRVVYRQDHGKLPCYKLKFIDGSEVTASYDHLWNVRKTCYISKKRHLHNSELADDYRVWTTEQIVGYLDKVKSGKVKNSRLVIPVCEPVQFTIGKKIRGIDPYLLGIILGDGCITEYFMKSNNVMFTTADEEIVQAFKDAGYTDVHSRTASKPIDYIFKSKEFVDTLKRLKLAWHKAYDKFVPTSYLFGTKEERLAVLQGLMDTDGTIDKRGHCSFASVSEQLAKDVKFLVNSLGGLATISRGESFYTIDGERHRASDVYNVYIRIENSERLFRLTRKKEKRTPYNGGVSEVARHIVDYEYVGEQEVCCIAVDNKNSLFMVEDFVVTHNSKSYSLLMETLKDVKNPNFRALILRNEKPDLTDLIEVSDELYGQYGDYNRSQNDMTWNFFTGAKLKFSYYEGEWNAFVKRFQGKQYAYIGLDEITHCPYKKFKYLMTDNRNAHNIRTRFIGTCNPDPDSWVAKFLDDGGWLDEEGFPIPEKDGLIRYCYMKGNDVNEIVWGDTRDEVFEMCKDDIMKHWKPAFNEFGTPQELSVKSVAFVEGKLEDNKILMKSNPEYIANLMNQDEEQQSRDLDGNWKFRSAGDDLIKMDDMIHFFENAYQNTTVSGDSSTEKQESTLYATADIALQGGDNFVMWLWEGFHIKDVYVCRFDSKTLIEVIKAKLKEWGVEEENLAYDFQGIGQILEGHFPNAVKFINQAAPIAKTRQEEEGIKKLYKDLKSQCAVLLYKAFRDTELSIDKHLLDRTFDGHGYGHTRLRDILMKERKCIRRTKESQGKAFQIISKRDMKKIIGHSPDFFESLLFRFIFVLAKKKHKKAKNTWCI